MTVKPAPDEVVWWSGLRWVEAAHMQVWRFEEAFGEEVAAVADARFRHQLSDSEDSRSWRESLDANYEPYDPQRPLRVPSWALHMQVANELDLLSVALRNVLRAQARIPEQHRPAMSEQHVLKLLRDVSEHWDEVGGRSASILAADHPDIEVGGIAYTNKEIWIGGLDGVPLSRIQAWLQRVWHALMASLADVGIEVPDDLLASRVEGDDELPWPAERLRFHWSVARLEEKDWPHGPTPEGVVEAPRHDVRQAEGKGPKGLARNRSVAHAYAAPWLNRRDDPQPAGRESVSFGARANVDVCITVAVGFAVDDEEVLQEEPAQHLDLPAPGTSPCWHLSADALQQRVGVKASLLQPGRRA